jgi:hypothetical protein
MAHKFNGGKTEMEIAIALSPEAEKRLREKAAQQGRDISSLRLNSTLPPIMLA